MKTKIKSLQILIISSLLLTSCIKSPFIDSENRTIHGQIIDSTTNQPISNTSFNLVIFQSKDLKWMSTPYPFVTDAQGNFKTTVYAKNEAELYIKFSINSNAIWWSDAQYTTDFNTGIIRTKKP